VKDKSGLPARGNLSWLRDGLSVNPIAAKAMLKSILRIAGAGLLIAAMAGLPLQAAAQGTNKSGATGNLAKEQKEVEVKKKAAHPFHGKLAAVDKTAKTIRVGKSIYQLTSETKITKGGKPATLDDAVVGEETAGYVKPTEDGEMAASSVRLGPKPDGTGGPKPKDKPKQ
jgi:hypothetical protein